MDFTKYFATRLARLMTPQREAIPNTPQLANSAGGYAWPVDQWTRLDRFLVLGSDGRTSLGYCAVAKFGKDPGKPLKEIIS